MVIFKKHFKLKFYLYIETYLEYIFACVNTHIYKQKYQPSRVQRVEKNTF